MFTEPNDPPTTVREDGTKEWRDQEGRLHANTPHDGTRTGEARPWARSMRSSTRATGLGEFTTKQTEEQGTGVLEAVLLHEALQMTTRELDQVDTALDAEPRVIPELTALIESVWGTQRQLATASATKSSRHAQRHEGHRDRHRGLPLREERP